MKLISLFVFVAFVFAAPAHAQRWDNKGWEKLGEREVDRKVDRDRIEVGPHEGVFTKLTLNVESSELELLDFEITFGNGEKFNPKVRHFFKEGARTRVIDLPGDKRIIKTIDLKFKNLPGGGKAKVEVWGWKAGHAERPAAWKFDTNGWKLLGERTVHGRMDKDRIAVGKYKGTFSKMTMVVYDSDLELVDFEVKFGKGPAWHPEVRHVFKEGERSRVIDFPGDERAIKFIDFKFKNLPGGGRAKVQVWAR
jgi:hypothetical protein